MEVTVVGLRPRGARRRVHPRCAPYAIRRICNGVRREEGGRDGPGEAPWLLTDGPTPHARSVDCMVEATLAPAFRGKRNQAVAPGGEGNGAMGGRGGRLNTSASVGSSLVS